MNKLNTVEKCIEQLEQQGYQDQDQGHNLELNTAYINIKKNIKNVQGLVGTDMVTKEKVYFDIFANNWGSKDNPCLVKNEKGEETAIDPFNYIWEILIKE